MTVRNKGIQIWRKEPDGAWKEIVVIVNPEPSPQQPSTTLLRSN
jgi:hypothetical protein